MNTLRKHGLMIVSFLLLFATLSMPLTTVILQPLYRPDIYTPLESAEPVGEKLTAMLWLNEDIEQADDQCVNDGYRWSSPFLGRAFTVWDIFTTGMWWVPSLYYYPPYIKRHKVPYHFVIAMLLLIFLLFGSSYIYRFNPLLRNVPESTMCNVPIPIFQVQTFHPFWPSFSAWLLSMVFGGIAMRRLPPEEAKSSQEEESPELTKEIQKKG